VTIFGLTLLHFYRDDHHFLSFTPDERLHCDQ